MENEKRSMKIMEGSASPLIYIRKVKDKRIESLNEMFQLPVVALRADLPQSMKGSPEEEIILGELEKAVKSTFGNKLLFEESYESGIAREILFVVRGDAHIYKENAVFTEENHPLGRFSDIDIYECQEEFPISRLEMGYAPRECCICGDERTKCSTEKRHEDTEIASYIRQEIDSYLKGAADKVRRV
ncbi:MAG: citrate lyase holo-[acyl-carrier protein] synthase [Youngiibacter sp.]|nr:citrate lyase holo-[acyl-carrier protein] synthase [Youngiibacter sp.]